MRHKSSRPTALSTYLPLLLVVLMAAAVHWRSLNTPFWLDDSWTANSVREPDLRSMLRYDGWMQVTPPLFLFALRWGVSWAEPDWVWRLLPWSGTILAAVLLYRLVKRELGLGWAAAGAALYLFSEGTLKQATTIKAFAWETALGVWLLTESVDAFRRPSARTFARVYAVSCLLCLSGYSAPIQVGAATALLLWSVWLRRRRASARGLLLGCLAGALASGCVFLLVYLTMLRPNIDPSLQQYWFQSQGAGALSRLPNLLVMLPGSAIMRAVPLAFLISWILALPVLLLAFLRAGAREWMRFSYAAAGWTIVVAAVAADLLAVVPLSPRGGVYLSAWWAVALIGTARLGWRLGGKSLSPATARLVGHAALVGVITGAAAAALHQHRNPPPSPEDFRSIVRDLKQGLTSRDLVVVHASTIEQFKHYSTMAGFPMNQVIKGNTAYPCCIRARRPFLLGTEEELERTAFPPGRERPERILLTVLNYAWHWRDCQGDEVPLWKRAIQRRGCRFVSSRRYGAADLLTFDCR